VSLVFSLHALAAQKMLQVRNYLRCHAAGKPAIHARRSKINLANSQSTDMTKDQVNFSDPAVIYPSNLQRYV
jgi:hypothetical protein